MRRLHRLSKRSWHIWKKNESIKNKQAREITHIKDGDQMKRLLRKMAEGGEIEPVPGAQYGGMRYQKKRK